MNISRDPRPDLINAEQQGCLLQALASEELRTERRELGDILCELHNAGLVNLVSDQNLSAIDALVHNDFWIVVHPLDKAIPNLNCSYIDILKLVHLLVNKAGSDAKGAGVWIQKPHLPPNADDQIFMACKCIGFLWHREVAAASILLRIVKHGQTEAQAEAEERKRCLDPTFRISVRLLMLWPNEVPTYDDYRVYA